MKKRLCCVWKCRSLIGLLYPKLLLEKCPDLRPNKFNQLSAHKVAGEQTKLNLKRGNKAHGLLLNLQRLTILFHHSMTAFRHTNFIMQRGKARVVLYLILQSGFICSFGYNL
jgi:hypothetical protein